MSERDDLAEVIRRADPHYPAVMALEIYLHMADAVIAAGWVRQHPGPRHTG